MYTHKQTHTIDDKLGKMKWSSQHRQKSNLEKKTNSPKENGSKDTKMHYQKRNTKGPQTWKDAQLHLILKKANMNNTEIPCFMQQNIKKNNKIWHHAQLENLWGNGYLGAQTSRSTRRDNRAPSPQTRAVMLDPATLLSHFWDFMLKGYVNQIPRGRWTKLFIQHCF